MVVDRIITEGRRYMWVEFRWALFEYFIPDTYIDEQYMHFLMLEQDEDTVHKYSIRFTRLARFTLELVVSEDRRVKKSI